MIELPQGFLEKLQKLGAAETPRVLAVRVADQKMTVFEGRQSKAAFSVSTARNGVGQKLNSFQTPLGLHRIKEKIGKDAPQGAIFDSREFKGEIWMPPRASAPPADSPAPDETASPANTTAVSDLITTRILWLEGLEPGVNAGADAEGNLVDSYQRYIYIHGTNHEDEIGRPSSRGCIRMTNAEIIALFDQVEVGDLVWIQE